MTSSKHTVSIIRNYGKRCKKNHNPITRGITSILLFTVLPNSERNISILYFKILTSCFSKKQYFFIFFPKILIFHPFFLVTLPLFQSKIIVCPVILFYNKIILQKSEMFLSVLRKIMRRMWQIPPKNTESRLTY